VGSDAQKDSEGKLVHPTHKANHAYIVFDNLISPLFDQSWTSQEELSLVQGIMNYGLGNWHDIAENFLKNKTAVECEEHYFGIIYKASEKS
jgi:hypothetical protein